ncbi:hypothetical protein [Sharpea azabuensis]|uniref:Uncharacterized protein n=1 Tax=Sharpea azabuensis TaxID=322505 RepID=A0A1H6X1U0_9FIRM|nr:hypothetical protein [Sharpea azabuensis]SEJ22106.1 hypothetical protein SAMN04487834_10775 [Sharpea azabuensis]
MKKRIAVFVLLIMAMVLCLVLMGCGQNTDNRPDENFDTGDSSIMDGTNNPEGTIFSKFKGNAFSRQVSL